MSIVIPDGFSNGHIRWVLSSDPQEMTTAIAFSSAPGTTPAEEAEIFNGAVSTGGLVTPSAVCDVYTYVGVRVERQTISGTIVSEVSQVIPGSMAGGCLPNNCAHLVDKLTNFGGRKQRGRMYFPPMYVLEGGIDHQGNMSTGSAADLTAAMELFRLAMVSAGIPPVLLHSSPADTPTLITGLRMQQQIATQRERMR